MRPLILFAKLCMKGTSNNELGTTRLHQGGSLSRRAGFLLYEDDSVCLTGGVRVQIEGIWAVSAICDR